MNIKRKELGLISVAAALLFSVPSYGLIVDRLYEADLITKSKSESERAAVLSEGLEQVLTRISGKPEVAKHPAVQAALKNPNKYVQQYAYQGDNLEATFNPGLVQKLLNDAQFPIWSHNRPELVLWLVIDTDKERRLVGSESDPSIVALVEKSARLRGLPVIVPLMDIEDMSRVTVTDVVGQFPSALEQASERYGYDGLLVGHIGNNQGSDPSQWQTQWRLIIDGKTHTWESNTAGINQAIQLGVDGVVDQLANLFAIAPNRGTNKDIYLMVEDIYSVSDYAKSMKYLKSLSHVQDVLVHRVEPNRTIFKVIPKNGGNLAAITSMMDLDDSMMAIAANQNQDVDVSYRWVTRGS